MKQKDIADQLEGKTIDSPDALAEALIEAGVTPEHEKAILGAINTYEIPRALGKSAGGLYYDFAERWNERAKVQQKKQRMAEADAEVERIKTWIADYEKNREALSPSELGGPAADLLEMAQSIERTVNPPKVDRSTLLEPVKWEAVLAELGDSPDALETSYRFPKEKGDADEDRVLRFPVGALSLLAAPTSHGKTTLLLNVLLDAARRDPNRRHWLFSFEEARGPILAKALTAYVRKPVSRNPLRSIRHYARTGTLEMFGSQFREGEQTVDARQYFEEREKEFSKLVGSGVINVVTAFDYDDSDLVEAIAAAAGDRPGFIGVDYVGLIPRREAGRGRNEELKATALDLKNAAIAHRVAIVGAVQFNRTVVHPGIMAATALQDSADLERAANLVVGMWNGNHLAQKVQGVGKDAVTVPKGYVYMRILKYRDGKVGRQGLFAHDGSVWTIDSEGAEIPRGGKKPVIIEIDEEAAGKPKKTPGQELIEDWAGY